MLCLFRFWVDNKINLVCCFFVQAVNNCLNSIQYKCPTCISFRSYVQHKELIFLFGYPRSLLRRQFFLRFYRALQNQHPRCLYPYSMGFFRQRSTFSFSFFIKKLIYTPAQGTIFVWICAVFISVYFLCNELIICNVA